MSSSFFFQFILIRQNGLGVLSNSVRNVIESGRMWLTGRAPTAILQRSWWRSDLVVHQQTLHWTQINAQIRWTQIKCGSVSIGWCFHQISDVGWRIVQFRIQNSSFVRELIFAFLLFQLLTEIRTRYVSSKQKRNCQLKYKHNRKTRHYNNFLSFEISSTLESSSLIFVSEFNTFAEFVFMNHEKDIQLVDLFHLNFSFEYCFSNMKSFLLVFLEHPQNSW